MSKPVEGREITRQLKEGRWLIMQDLRAKGLTYKQIGLMMRPTLSLSQVSRTFIKNGVRAHPGVTHKCFVCDDRFRAKDWYEHYASTTHIENTEDFIEGLGKIRKAGE